MGLIHVHVLRADGQAPALRHGVPRVDAEVHQHLLHLRRIARHVPEVVGHVDVDVQVGAAERLGHDPLDLVDHVGRIHRDALALDAPRERQDLLDHVGAALRALADHRQRPAGALVFEARLEHLDAERDGHKQVAEIVGDAAHEAADALHPLRPQELTLQLLALRDVGVDDQYALGLALRRADERPPALDGERVAVLRGLCHLARPLARVEHLAPHLFHDRGARADEVILDVRPEDLLGRPAGEALGALVPVRHLAVERKDADGITGLVEQLGLGPDLLLRLAAADGVADGPLQQRGIDLTLHEVVGRARFDGFEADVEVALPREEDERHRMPGLLDGPDEIEAVVRAEAVVDEARVERLLLQHG